MTTNPLDAIQERADLAECAWEDFQHGIATTRFALDEANNSAEDVKPLVAALRAVEAVHEKAPVYDTWASDCGHDDCDGVELADGESYCPRSVVDYTCEHCADLSRDNMNGELPDWPCPTITAIREALGG